MQIAFVENRTSGVSKTQHPSWMQLSKRLARCDIGEKDGSGWLPADIEVGPRVGARVKSVSLLVLDVEAKAEMVLGLKQIVGAEPPAPDAMQAELALWGWRCILHTSFNYSDEHPRYRLVFDIDRPLAAGEIKPLGLHVAALLGISDCIDTSCLEPARLFYLPRCPAERKDQFRHAELQGEPLPVDELLAEVAKIAEAKKVQPKKLGKSGGVIDTYNDAHDIGAILEEHGYKPHGGRRWLWSGSTTGLPGVRLLPDAVPPRVYSSHGGDPLNNGHAHDAFSVFCLLQHNGDMSAAVKDAARICGLETYTASTASVVATAVREQQPATGDAPAADPASHIVVVSLLDFVTREIRPRERILAPWLLTQSLNMAYAWRGIGKTHVALGIAFATASGGSFLKWKAGRPRRVLFLDGEMPAASMQERLKGLIASTDDDFDPEFFRLVTPDLQLQAMPDLATQEGQAAIDAIMGDTELIIIDNLSSLARSGGRENDAESWLPIQPWALRQRQQGRSVIFFHHSGKGGAQRGTSKREDILDCVINLRRPAEYNPEDGAVFEVHFEKTRDMHGQDVEPFEARLQTDAQGKSVWTFSSVEDSTFNRVVTLANDGLSQKEIALELGVNKSNVSRHMRKATILKLVGKDDPDADS